MVASCSREYGSGFTLPFFPVFTVISTVFRSQTLFCQGFRGQVESHRSAHNPEVMRFKSHPRNQKRTDTRMGVCSFSSRAGFSMTSAGGHGLRARAPPVAEAARTRREKIRSVEESRTRSDYIFDRAMKNPIPATKKSLGTTTIPRLFSFLYDTDLLGSIPIFLVGCLSVISLLSKLTTLK